MELVTVTTNLAEPITVSEVKTFLGYPSADQDALISKLITASREFVEKRTALSLVEKNYQAYFERDECDDEGWFELPVSPVNSTTKTVTVSMSGTATTFQQKGIKRVKIKPDAVFGTILSDTTDTYYLVIDFWAGSSNQLLNSILLSIVASRFNHRDEGVDINIASLPFDTIQMINQVTMNL